MKKELIRLFQSTIKSTTIHWNNPLSWITRDLVTDSVSSDFKSSMELHVNIVNTQ